MTDKLNKVTVKTTGPFELRDPIQNVDINEKEVEVLETSFVVQMLGLKRLKVVKGEQKQEWNPEESNQNPSVGEALPTRDNEITIKELEENKTPGRGRPAKK